ncbi:MAG: T9SS type A sorting domain-containing protein [FCB group bacterium]
MNLTFTGQANPQTISLKGKISPTAVNDITDYVSYLKAYPNPTNNNINIEYSLENPMQVDMYIYNMQGELINNLGTHLGNSGINNLEWNGRDNNAQSVPNGMYNLIMRANNFIKSYKIAIIK